MFAKDSGLLQGTLELLVLKTLSWGPMHGYGIASWIESATDDVLRVEEGSLYPALYRMTRKGWISATWGTSDNNRRAKYYSLTTEGRGEYREQTSGWQRFATAVNRAIGTTSPPSWGPWPVYQSVSDSAWPNESKRASIPRSGVAGPSPSRKASLVTCAESTERQRSGGPIGRASGWKAVSAFVPCACARAAHMTRSTAIRSAFRSRIFCCSWCASISSLSKCFQGPDDRSSNRSRTSADTVHHLRFAGIR